MTIAFYEHPFSLLGAEGEDGSLREGHSVRVEDDRRLGAGGKRGRGTHPRNLTVMMQSATPPCT
jgi:hypothetical protein